MCKSNLKSASNLKKFEFLNNINNKDQLHLKLIDNQGVMVYFIISKGLQNLNLSVELKRIVINKKGKNYGKNYKGKKGQGQGH